MYHYVHDNIKQTCKA